ncbi:MAG TPA: putative beta-lysine N-acetyltransferase [Candidatus Thermoplasmatota archaeon]|nr:putative beta-lysine N-acetyltransferase [Candidatus Thermoplasmatota archaeon]
MFDTVESLNHSLIQHGPLNNRIYLMSLEKRDFPQIFSLLDNIAEKNGYTKIFAKVPSWAVNKAKNEGFEVEAEIPGFFNNEIDGFFLGKFLNHSRKNIHKTNLERIKEIHQVMHDYSTEYTSKIETKEPVIEQLCSNDANALAKLYGSVFETYPFPIFDADYLKRMMHENVRYYGIFEDEKLIAASAAEMDPVHLNVEMTDFATLPEGRGNSYALSLLLHMEKEMKNQKIRTAFTIARAVSFGMNITFAKARYSNAGLLKNNTAIAGSLESMNVLFKKL